MSQIIYYLLLRPLSLLPLTALYLISDFLYLIIYKLLGYRKRVVSTNIKNSFPEKSDKEIQKIIQEFYHHFCDLLVESIKIFSISKEEAIRRCKILNPEVIEKYHEEGKNLIVVTGHYNNWEMAAVACSPQFRHKLVGIYKPLRCDFFNKKFRGSRMKYGLELLPKKEVKEFFRNQPIDVPTATIFAGDQSPTSSKRVYWTRFLNQETAVLYGTEKYATEYNYPVVFAIINKVKRGYYEVKLEVLEEKPSSAEYCSITERHTRLLEEQIKQQPQYWLWTHKRWKRKRELAKAS